MSIVMTLLYGPLTAPTLKWVTLNSASNYQILNPNSNPKCNRSKMGLLFHVLSLPCSTAPTPSSSEMASFYILFIVVTLFFCPRVIIFHCVAMALLYGPTPPTLKS